MSAKVKAEASSPKQSDERAEENELTERLELDFVEESAGDEWDADVGAEHANAFCATGDTEEEDALKPSPDSPRSLSAPRSPEDEVETIDEDTVMVEAEEAIALHTGEEDEVPPEGDGAAGTTAPSVRPMGGGGPKTPPESDHKGASSNDVSQESSMREPQAKRRRHRRRSSSCSSSSSAPSHPAGGEMNGKKENDGHIRKEDDVYEADVAEDSHSAVSRGRDKSLTGSSPRHRRRRHRRRSKSPPKSYKISDRRDRSPHDRRATDRGMKREHYSDEHEEDDENMEEVVEDEMDYEEDDEERIRRNKRARLVRLREARSRQIGREYIPSLASRKTSAIGGRFPPQPYFKNPSYYPRDKELSSSSASRSVAVPVPLARVEPMPGGRLPLVQRRSSPPPPSVSQRRRAVSPQAPPAPLLTKKRRYIVEEISHVPRRWVGQFWEHILSRWH